jgi:hypothetical protein
MARSVHEKMLQFLRHRGLIDWIGRNGQSEADERRNCATAWAYRYAADVQDGMQESNFDVLLERFCNDLCTLARLGKQEG